MRLEPREHPKAWSVEHLVPLSRGGANKWQNKLLAHQKCNRGRGAPFVWMKLREFRRLAMERIKDAAASNGCIAGPDPDSSYPISGGSERAAMSSRQATLPAEMACEPLRVTLGEAFLQPTAGESKS